MIISFIGQGLSEQEIWSFIPVGGYKMARLRNEMADPSLREKRMSKKLVLVVSQTQTNRTSASLFSHWKQQTFLKMVSLARIAA